MSLIVFAIIVVILVAMAIWLIGYIPIADARVRTVLHAAIVLVGIILILSRAGILAEG